MRLGLMLLAVVGVACGDKTLRLADGGQRGTGGSQGGAEAAFPAGGAVGESQVGDASAEQLASGGLKDGADPHTTGDDAAEPKQRDGGGQLGDAAALGIPDTKAPRVRSLTQVLKRAPWADIMGVQGMAVDSSGRVYVGDFNSIYMVEGDSVSSYLALAESGLPFAKDAAIGDFDIGPDGTFYIGISTYIANEKVVYIARSSRPHQAEQWFDPFATSYPVRVGVVGTGKVAVVTIDGMWFATGNGATKIYDRTILISTQRCAMQDLATAPSGVFLYQPGCSISPILRGNVDGSGASTLYLADGVASPILASDFLCSCRDPAGGFLVVVRNYKEYAPRLYHVDEDVQGRAGLTWIETKPTFQEARQVGLVTDALAFNYCSLAAAPDGTIYFQTYSQVWKVEP